VARRADFHPFLKDFLQLLVEHHRMAGLPVIFELFLQEMSRLRGEVKAAITTARPLEGSRRRQLDGDLSRVLGRRVELTARVDPDLIGGIRLEVEGRIYDGSVRRQLERLKEELAASA
jgi:F-type H+-transporting ATPase subunit delta